MMGNSRQRRTNALTGRWRITEMDLWEQDDIDLVAPGFVEFSEGHRGSLEFIARRRDRLARGSPRWLAGRGVHVGRLR